MKALDLFCGAGGASAGLALEGFQVFGVDVIEQPRYPYLFARGDALAVSPAFLRSFDLVWASPPCQAFTAYKRRPGHVAPAGNLIPRTRALLEAAGVPFILENVPGARDELRNPVQLCGSSFGLDVRRHRLFECSFPVEALPCSHGWQTPRFPPAGNRTNLRSTVEVGVWRIPLDVQRRAMGINWMERRELSNAIPPAYSAHLARAWKKHTGRTPCPVLRKEIER
jgi:DNA (cytosine-5)-methyltransferase 1